MRVGVILILLLFYSVNSLSQIQDSVKIIEKVISPTFNYKFESYIDIKSVSYECPYTIKNAINDIKKETIKIVIQVGFIAPIGFDDLKSKEFQRKYNVKFEYLGCIRGWDIKDEDVTGYNEKMFEYLINKYGDIVRTEFSEIKG